MTTRTAKKTMRTARTIDPPKGQLTTPLTHRRPDIKLALALLLIGTTLGTSPAAFAGRQGQSALLHPAAEPGAALTLIDSDDDDDDDKGGWLWPKSRGDDDDDDCEEEDDDDCEAGANGSAAKAGTVAPPKNGLFTNGTAPLVKSN